MLAPIWEAAGYLGAGRLQAALPSWLPWRRRPLTPTLDRSLLAISPRQLARRLQARRQAVNRRLSGTTRPGSLLKHLILIKTDQWDVTTPGYLAIDLLSHAGVPRRPGSCCRPWTAWTFRRAGGSVKP